MDQGTTHSHLSPDHRNPVKKGQRSVWGLCLPLRGASDLLAEGGESVCRKRPAEGPRDEPVSWGHFYTAHVFPLDPWNLWVSIHVSASPTQKPGLNLDRVMIFTFNFIKIKLLSHLVPPGDRDHNCQIHTIRRAENSGSIQSPSSGSQKPRISPSRWKSRGRRPLCPQRLQEGPLQPLSPLGVAAGL